MDEHFASARGMIHFDWDPMPELPEPEKRKAGKHMGGTKSFFWRKYMILIVGATLFTIYSVCLSGYVNYKAARTAKAETAAAVKSAVKSERQHIFDVMEITEEQFAEKEKAKEEGKPTILTGQASYDNALALIEEPLAKHVASLRQIRKCTKAGAETYAWVDIAILKSGKFGNKLTDFLSDPEKIEGYSETVNVREEDTAIAHKVAEMVMSSKFPNGFTIDYQYAVINADGSVTARNEYNVSSTTRFWEAEG